jgi:hypothetical protein
MLVVIAASTIWIGLTWLVLALLIGLPLYAAYSAYLIRRFSAP